MSVSGDFTIIDAPQRSPEWFAARVGRLTGSCAGDMLARIKSGEAACRRDLRTRLVCERLTGQPQEDSYINADMQRGIDKEPDAFAAYEALTGQMVSRTGFLAHNTLMAGCSLDGHIGDFAGILELKCPRSANHLRYLRAGVVPTEHLPQIIHNLFITNASWCDFVSFDDRFPAALQVFRVRVAIEDVDLEAYHLALSLFLTEVEKDVEAVKALAGVAA